VTRFYAAFSSFPSPWAVLRLFIIAICTNVNLLMRVFVEASTATPRWLYFVNEMERKSTDCWWKQGLFNQLLNVYNSSGDSGQSCLTPRPNWHAWVEAGCLFLWQPIVYQSSVSPVNTQPRQSSHQLVSVDYQTPFHNLYKICTILVMLQTSFYNVLKTPVAGSLKLPDQ